MLSTLVRSWKKSRQLRRLQLIIAPPGESIDDLLSGFRARLVGAPDRKQEALAHFLDLCEDDEGIQYVMKRYGLNREDLKKRSTSLRAGGLGRWCKGHYAALSTIAYVEPLMFLVESERHGMSRQQIISHLLDYWNGKIGHGKLASLIQ